MESVAKEIVQFIGSIIILGFLMTAGIWILWALLVSREYRKYPIYRKDDKGRYSL